MPNRKKQYRDMEKYIKTCNSQKKRYYDKTAIYKPSCWTSKQDELVLKHTFPDSELSAKIGHSVEAIQIRRSRLKKANKKGVD